MFKEKYEQVYGSEVELKVQIPDREVDVLWLFNNDILDSSCSKKYAEANGSQPSLKIYDINKSDVGSYVCKIVFEADIENEKMEEMSSPIKVELKGKTK